MKTQIRLLITLLCTATACFLVGLALLTPAHAARTPAALTWSVAQYDFGSVPVGQTPSYTFTLSNTGGMSSGTIMVTLAGSAAFSITGDGCTGRALGGGNSCNVTVQHAPINTNGDTGTLTATGERTSTGMNLHGNGNAVLLLSPGTLFRRDDCGETIYNYDNNLEPGDWSRTFTVRNVGGITSDELELACCTSPEFRLSDDRCTGNELAPG